MAEKRTAGTVPCRGPPGNIGLARPMSPRSATLLTHQDRLARSTMVKGDARRSVRHDGIPERSVLFRGRREAPKGRTSRREDFRSAVGRFGRVCEREPLAEGPNSTPTAQLCSRKLDVRASIDQRRLHSAHPIRQAEGSEGNHLSATGTQCTRKRVGAGSMENAIGRKQLGRTPVNRTEGWSRVL